MKTLNIYVTRELVIILVAAIGILTFAMVGGNLLQVFNFISRGVPVSDAMKFAVYVAPMALSYTIPWGILVSVLLLFGRMSANNEITAMRACGISIFQIISPLIALTFVLTVICIYLQAYASPIYLGKGRALIKDVALTNPTALIVPGVPSEFGNMLVTVKSKTKDNHISGIQIYTFNKDKTFVKQDITAGNGLVKANTDKGTLSLILYNYNIISYKEKNTTGDRVYGKELIVTLDTAKQINSEPLSQKLSYMTFTELMGSISLYRKHGLDPTVAEVQLGFNVAMGLSPISFLLLGLPLAIRTSRKETSIGLFVSVILAGLYFSLMIACQAMSGSPNLYPKTLLWIPNIAYQLGGLFFLLRISGR
ncbi:MAG TPA: LptF/LptG family permease [Victivallales bacterium]|nr:LptF/LptG family permease [Victivallales bacterium]